MADDTNTAEREATYLCQAWGETDLPSAAIVRDLDAVRAFLVEQWLGDEDQEHDDGTKALPAAMSDMQEQWELEGEAWKWSISFEIGGISVQRVDDVGRASLAASAIETKRYADGTTATGIGPLPKHSPSVQHALRVLTDVESMLGGANGPTIQIRAVLESLAASAGSEPVAAGSINHLKLMMEESAWGGQILLSDALANIDEFAGLHHSPPEGMAGWKPIETAPKDGTYLLLWEQYSTHPFVGYWGFGSWSASHEHVDAEGGWDGANVVDSISQDLITHWMPLPATPLPASEAKEL